MFILAKHKNKQPKIQPKPTEVPKIETPVKPSKLKRFLRAFKLPKFFTYLVKFIFASGFVVLLIQCAISLLQYVTETGMVKIASVTNDTSKSLLVSQLNQQLNLTTYISAILISVTIIIFIWKLIIQPIKNNVSRFKNWLNK